MDWERVSEKAKSFFANLKQEVHKTPVKCMLVMCAVLFVIAGIGGATSPNRIEPKSIVEVKTEEPLFSDREVQEARIRCSLMRANENYKDNSGISETELFQKAEESCIKSLEDDEQEKVANEINNISKEWELKSSAQLAGRPLSYYYLQAKDNTDTESSYTIILSSSLKSVKEEDRKAEEAEKAAVAEKKAEEEATAKKQAEQKVAAANTPAQSTGTGCQRWPSGTNRVVEGCCKDGTSVRGNPSAKGRANACYGKGGWMR